MNSYLCTQHITYSGKITAARHALRHLPDNTDEDSDGRSRGLDENGPSIPSRGARTGSKLRWMDISRRSKSAPNSSGIPQTARRSSKSRDNLRFVSRISSTGIGGRGVPGVLPGEIEARTEVGSYIGPGTCPSAIRRGRDPSCSQGLLLAVLTRRVGSLRAD